MRLKHYAIVIIFFIMLVPVLAWNVGDRILGQWSDGYWYPAKIGEKIGDEYRINFDDGDTSTVPDNKIKGINWGVGTQVQCNWQKKGMYYSGKITSMNGENIHISYDDGDQEDATISICRSK